MDLEICFNIFGIWKNCKLTNLALYGLWKILALIIRFVIPFFFHISRQQEAEASAGGGVTSAPLVSELRLLRQRKDELEGHLSSLQESRKHLMHQLEGLMRMLKVTLQKYLSVFLFYTVTSYSTAPFPTVLSVLGSISNTLYNAQIVNSLSFKLKYV